MGDIQLLGKNTLTNLNNFIQYFLAQKVGFFTNDIF